MLGIQEKWLSVEFLSQHYLREIALGIEGTVLAELNYQGTVGQFQR